MSLLHFALTYVLEVLSICLICVVEILHKCAAVITPRSMFGGITFVLVISHGGSINTSYFYQHS